MCTNTSMNIQVHPRTFKVHPRTFILRLPCRGRTITVFGICYLGLLRGASHLGNNGTKFEGNTWQYKEVPGNTRQYLAIPGNTWQYQAILGSTWQYLAILNSEGQRRALFEDCETERKSNIEEISKLKKENSDLVTSLHQYSNSTAKLKVQKRKIEHLIGPIDNKEGSQVKELLDLQLIDKSKRLDLLRYQIKKRRDYLSQLGKKYQTLLSEQAKRDAIIKVDIPIKKAVCDIQNNIHAVEVQLREADHIKGRYQVIKDALLEDAAKSDSKIKKIEDDLVAQSNEIEKLRQVLREALTLKNNAKKQLHQEEKHTSETAKGREKQLEEGKQLVSARKSELEVLEKKIYQSGKITARPEPDGAEETNNQADDDKSETMAFSSLDVLERSFEKLKAATGASTAEETLKKFSDQKDTLERLITLKTKAEDEKQQLEKKLEKKSAELEYLKYAQVSEVQRKSGEEEKKNALLIELQEKTKEWIESAKQSRQTIQSTLARLQKLELHINPTVTLQKDPLVVLENVKTESKKLIESYRHHKEAEYLNEKDEHGFQDEKWLPTPYTSLLRKTPVPQQGTPPAALAPSEDEEEVPSRGHLKRQAQIVVDAKSRRKNIRMQLPRRV